MRAPMFVIGTSAVWALMLVSFSSDSFAYFGCGLGLAAFVVSILIPKTREERTIPVSAAAVTVACALFLTKNFVCYYPATNLAGQKYNFEGIVTEAKYDEEYEVHRYTVRVTTLKNSANEAVKTPPNFKVRMSSKSYDGEIDDTVRFSGKLKELKPYYRAKGYYVGVTSYGEVEFEKSDSHSLLYRAQVVRDFAKNTLKGYLPDNYALVLLGMVDGDKNDLPTDIYDNFKAAGVVHLLSVSGFHTSLWGMLVYRWLLKLGLGKRNSAVGALIFLMSFVVVTGFSRSTIRSGAMLSLFFLARILSQSADSLNSLGFAATLICVSEPFVCADIGFLLSFFSTLGILVLYPKFKDEVRPKIKRIVHDFRVRKRVNEISDLALISVCAFIFNFPIMILFFGDVSIISPLSNILISPLASVSIYLGGIGILLSAIPFSELIVRPLLLVSGVLTKLVVQLSSWFAGLPMSTVDITGDYIKVTVAALLILLALDTILKIENKKLTAGLSAIIIFGSVASHAVVSHYLV